MSNVLGLGVDEDGLLAALVGHGELRSLDSVDAGCSPMAPHCSDQSIGRSVRRLMQNPRGSRPSIAASARAGDMKARDSVIRIERSLLPSRMASDSMVWVGS